MIQLATLVKNAPFSEKNKQSLISSISSMNDDQKFKLSEFCWNAIITVYRIRLKRITDSMMWDIARGVKYHTKNDFEEAKAKLYFELAEKLEATQTTEDLGEVRKRLSEQSVQFPTQPAISKQ